MQKKQAINSSILNTSIKEKTWHFVIISALYFNKTHYNSHSCQVFFKKCIAYTDPKRNTSVAASASESTEARAP